MHLNRATITRRRTRKSTESSKPSRLWIWTMPHRRGRSTLRWRKFPGSEERLFSEAQSREMWTAQTLTLIGADDSPLGALRPKFAAYALGWGIRDYHGRKLVGHTGGVSGFVSRVMLAPEENLGMVILTNAEQGGAFDSIMYHVLDAYFGLPSTDWTPILKSAEDRFEKAAKQAV